MAPPTGATLLRRLEKIRDQYGEGASARKQELIRQLTRRRLRTAEQVERLHECLCVLRAYPDDADLLALVETALDRFDRRSDLREHAEELVDTGIAGTALYYTFFWFTAAWLEQRWPAHLSIDWEASQKTADELWRLLPWLMPFAETPGQDELDYEPREWLEIFRNRSETDASFLIRRFRQLPVDAVGRELLYESMATMLRLDPGADTPSRTKDHLAGTRVTFQSGPLVRGRPVLRNEVSAPPRGVRRVSRAEGERIIDLTRAAMVNRHRDLYMFAHADPDDVFLVDCGDGLAFAGMGTKAARRLVLETSYGFLTLKNGVPMGYILASSLFGSTEVAYNVFETYRGGEAGHVFGRLVAMVVHLFGSDVLSIDPYQLGHDNEEGLASGAWWFYYKLGFRPLDPDVKQLVARELARMKKDPSHRSTRETLQELSAAYMYWFVDDERSDVLGQLPIGYIGERVSRYLARRFGADREGGLATCSSEAAKRLGVRLPRKEAERQAWERWSPIVMILPGVGRWSAANRKALAVVIRAKGAKHEGDFVRLFNAHPLLGKALARLASDPADD